MASKKEEKEDNANIESELNETEMKEEVKKIENKETKIKVSKPSWIKMKPEEMEKIVVGLANQGESPAKIGLILRDKYGIPKSRLFGKRITEILEEKGIKYKTKKDIFKAKIEKLRAHIGKNRCDYGASRALTKKLWVIYNYDKTGK